MKHKSKPSHISRRENCTDPSVTRTVAQVGEANLEDMWSHGESSKQWYQNGAVTKCQNSECSGSQNLRSHGNATYGSLL